MVRNTRSILKNFLGKVLFVSGIYKIRLHNKVVVVTFHRVNDSSSRHLSCPASLFGDYCKFFNRFFNVISLSDMLRLRRSDLSFNRNLIVTFDDGYKDNYEIAAPILRSNRLPGTFFLCTDFVGSDYYARWDEKYGEHHPWMTWEDVKQLDIENFELGSHSKTHTDLSSLTEQQIRQELVESKASLEEKLNKQIDLFAYPFGGRENINHRDLQIVQSVGYQCCCSCFGGVNDSSTDPYQINRIPVDGIWTSPWEFGFDLVMGRI